MKKTIQVPIEAAARIADFLVSIGIGTRSHAIATDLADICSILKASDDAPKPKQKVIELKKRVAEVLRLFCGVKVPFCVRDRESGERYIVERIAFHVDGLTPLVIYTVNGITYAANAAEFHEYTHMDS
jgi:hypothetical protein